MPAPDTVLLFPRPPDLPVQRSWASSGSAAGHGALVAKTLSSSGAGAWSRLR